MAGKSYINHVHVDPKAASKADGVKYFFHARDADFKNPTLKFLSFALNRFHKAVDVFIQRRIKDKNAPAAELHVSGSIVVTLHPDDILQLIDMAFDALTDNLSKHIVVRLINRVYISLSPQHRTIMITIEYNEDSHCVFHLTTLMEHEINGLAMMHVDKNKFIPGMTEAKAVEFFMFRNNFVIPTKIVIPIEK